MLSLWKRRSSAVAVEVRVVAMETYRLCCSCRSSVVANVSLIRASSELEIRHKKGRGLSVRGNNVA